MTLRDVDILVSQMILYFLIIRLNGSHMKYCKNRKETPQKLTQLSSRSHPRHLVGKKDSTKRHHHRHHKRQPGEQQFPKQVVTG